MPTQIQAVYTAPFTPGSDMATQEAEMGFTPLDQGDTLPSALQIVSDVTLWNGTVFERTVVFEETPETVARLGLPATDAKRRALVIGLFKDKISLRIRKPVTELVTVLP